MSAPVVATRPVGTSRKRVSKIANAADTLAGFGHGTEVDVLTFGQFSIIDAIEAVLDITGPASVTLATWTAAEFDLSQIEAQLLRARITDLRLIIDRSFVSRQPRFVGLIHDRFGADSVRSTRTHAKFVVIHNVEWSVVIRTSMNLNHNPRLEYMQVVDDTDLASMYLAVADALFKEEPPGLENRRNVPELVGVAGVEPSIPVRMGKPPRVGYAPRMGGSK